MKEDENKIKQLDGKIRELERYIEELMREKEKLGDDLGEEQQENTRLKGELEKSEKRIYILEQAKQDIEERNQKREREIRDFEGSVRELRQKVEEITITHMGEKKEMENQISELSSKNSEIMYTLNQRNIELQRKAKNEQEYKFLNERLVKDKERLE